MTTAEESSPTATVLEPARGIKARLSTPEFHQWLVELVRFVIVGGASFVIDLGLFNMLVYGPGHVLGGKPLTAKVISVVIATLASWIGNRHWTFSEKRSQQKGRELLIYGVLNAIGALIPVGTLAISRYGLHLAGPLQDNAATIIGIAIATVFRYVGYKLWVFTGAKDDEAAIAATQL
ncbi:MAG TPA: GtrA family protein [Cellulomonas sp.]